jgi:hypothetical protein
MEGHEAAADRRLDPRLVVRRDDDVGDLAGGRARDLQELPADQPARVVEDHVDPVARAALCGRGVSDGNGRRGGGGQDERDRDQAPHGC